MPDMYDCALRNHSNAVMINGMTTELSMVRVLARKGQLPLFSHFDFIAPFTQSRTFGLHLKVATKQQRLAGFDAQIYQGLGSRMHTSTMDVVQEFQAYVESMSHLKPSLPVPAGNQWIGSLRQLHKLFGSRDFAIVPGRAVFPHPMGSGVGAAALLQGWEAYEKGVSLKG